MSSQISICNQALRKLGANPITSIDQDTTEAAICKVFYDDVRDDLLEEYPWTFATKRYELPKSAETPPKPYSAQFLVPPDVLRIIQASDRPDFDRTNHLDWVVEGGFILADSGTMFLQVIFRVTDPLALSSKFVRAFVARLAAEMSLPITQSREMHRQLMEEFGLLMGSAMSADSQQGRTRTFRSTALTSARG